MMKKPVAYFFLLAQLIPGTVFAGDYEMVLGKGIEVCEAYLKNLNSFPKEPPMVCERKLDMRFPEFQKPSWKELDIEQNMGLLKEINRYQSKGRANFDSEYEKMLPQIRQNIKERRFKLSSAHLDMDHDGTPEHLLKFEADSCDPKNESMFAMPSGRRFYVLASDEASIDFLKTNLLLPTAPRPDIFLYKGNVYFDNWGGNLNFKDGQIDIIAFTGHGKVRSCNFSYKPTRRGS